MNFMNKSWLKTRPRRLQKAASKQIWKEGQIKFDDKIRSSQFLAEKVVVYHIILFKQPEVNGVHRTCSGNIFMTLE